MPKHNTAFGILIFLMMSSFHTSAQQWVKGYIVSRHSKDTTRGYICKFWKGNIGPQTFDVLFKRTLTDTPHIYEPDKLLAFGFKNPEIYRAVILSTKYLPFPFIIPDSCVHRGRPEYDMWQEGWTTPAQIDLLPDSFVLHHLFAHLLLQTTSFQVFETNFEKQRYYLLTPNHDSIAHELLKYEVLPQSGYPLYYIDSYREQLKSLLSSINAPKKRWRKVEKSINSSVYTAKQIISVVHSLAKLQADSVYYPKTFPWQEPIAGMIFQGAVTLGVILCVVFQTTSSQN